MSTRGASRLKLLRLTEHHHEAVERLLLQDPLVNLFLLGYLRSVPIPRAWWYGATAGDEVLGLILLVPGRLMVPWSPDPELAASAPKPVLVLAGTLDPLVEPAALRAHGVEPRLLDGVNHFFSRRLGNQPAEPRDLDALCDAALGFLVP